ncbi:unnamed protein product [Linum trigynum]|uniref:Secreted protein n=1 Tax=Linum trigynum TaxID=586398 RepID=A0AAV2E265_9ROSI
MWGELVRISFLFLCRIVQLMSLGSILPLVPRHFYYNDNFNFHFFNFFSINIGTQMLSPYFTPSPCLR